MARLFADENFPLLVVQELRRLGHGVLMVAEAGKANQRWPDERLFAFAQAEQRAVLTLNRGHFKRLHRQSQAAHSGIVICTKDNDFAALARRIHARLTQQTNLAGQLLRINRPPT